MIRPFFLCLFFIPFSVFSQSNCEGVDQRAFDYWIGDWKVTIPNGKIAGYNSIKPIHGGCALEENYIATTPYRGSSYNHYDAKSGKWKQRWIDNSGLVLDFSGEISNNTLVTHA
ncbi:MAG: hypothetical protein HKN16_01280, partial [Saprospiraceae bacterium]|nr:hypothetical protein [Saprospiraceae bacterium]